MPLNEIGVPGRVVGAKAVRRALSEGGLAKVFIARDAKGSIVDRVEEQARLGGIPVEWADNMEKLGRACAIGCKAAAAGIPSGLKN